MILAWIDEVTSVETADPLLLAESWTEVCFDILVVAGEAFWDLYWFFLDETSIWLKFLEFNFLAEMEPEFWMSAQQALEAQNWIAL